MKLVISEPKTGKAYSKKIESVDALINKKIGDEVQLDAVGLPGYVARISGGSDRGGFPMRRDLPGAARKKILLTKKHGKRVRKSVRGNIVGEETSQLNLVITKAGQKGLDTLLGKPAEEKEETEKDRIMREREAAEAGKEGAAAEEKNAGKEKEGGGNEAKADEKGDGKEKAAGKEGGKEKEAKVGKPKDAETKK